MVYNGVDHFKALKTTANSWFHLSSCTEDTAITSFSRHPSEGITQLSHNKRRQRAISGNSFALHGVRSSARHMRGRPERISSRTFDGGKKPGAGCVAAAQVTVGIINTGTCTPSRSGRLGCIKSFSESTATGSAPKEKVECVKRSERKVE